MTYEGKACTKCGSTTRYKRSRACVACSPQKGRNYRRDHRDQINAVSRARYRDDPGYRARRIKSVVQNQSQQDPRVRSRRAFANSIRRQYDLSVEEYAWMFKRQQGLCAICSTPLDLSKPSGCNVDHDHKTGKKGIPIKVRGLLHGYCNYRYLGHVERGGKDRWKNAGVYLGWA